MDIRYSPERYTILHYQIDDPITPALLARLGEMAQIDRVRAYVEREKELEEILKDYDLLPISGLIQVDTAIGRALDKGTSEGYRDAAILRLVYNYIAGQSGDASLDEEDTGRMDREPYFEFGC